MSSAQNENDAKIIQETLEAKKIPKSLIKKSWNESLKLAYLSIPFGVTQVCLLLSRVITSYFSSKLNTLEVTGLSESILTVVCLFTGGMAAAFFMLVSETSDENRATLNPTYFTRAIMQTSVWCCFVTLFLAFSRPLYFDWITTPEIAHQGQIFCRISIFGMWTTQYTIVIVMYLHAHRVVFPQITVISVLTLLYIPLTYLLYNTRLGVYGIAISYAIYSLVNFSCYAIVLVLYCRHWQWKLSSFFACSRIFNLKSAMFHLVIALASAATTMNEVLALELVKPVSSLVGKNVLLVNIIFTQIDAVFVAFYMSLGIAITIRVAGKFSQGKHVKAIFISRLATILLFSLSTIVCVILFLLRAPLGRLFTTSNTVINLMTANIAISLLFMLLDSVRIALGGIFAAMGKHALLAVLTFAEFFVIAVPLMLLVSFVWFKKNDLLVLRFTWLAFCLAVSVFIILATIVLSCIDWKAQAMQSKKRELTELGAQSNDEVSVPLMQSNNDTEETIVE